MANPLSGEGRDDPQAFEDQNTKKVRFKEGKKDKAIDMVVDLDAVPTLSSTDKLLGKRVVGIEKTNVVSGIGVNEDFDFLEGDVTRSIVNGIPVIGFSNRIQQILFKEMVKTVVLKLMGRSIGLSRLLSIFYKKKILEEIGGMIGKVAKLDFNTDKRTRGCFIGMAVYVNLDKSFVSQVLVNEAIQQVEFESLMTIYFSCGRYGHVKEMCPKPVVDLN
ncbi:hypothetical protein Gorai_014727 [Gossypium raimondii]|uniref:CCHC-type domain-containing protein n=1 Tax=Gossypium raimondii TaxID=29730 RepID=A0A7J8P3Y4_GOSRA|nr:hypothetical protein [Gossypium raimondii]